MTAHNLPADFTPVPVRPRRDGWTADRQEAFLKALANCGVVAHAARAVGMSRQSVNNLYNRPGAGAFRRAFDAALDCSLVLVEQGMWSRAIEGVARPIFYQGEQVGEYRHFDEKLGMFLLRTRRPQRFAMKLNLEPLPPPPSLVDEGPDPDEAIGSLDFYLEDLVDDSELPGSEAEDAPIDGDNFVNFQPEPPGTSEGFGEQE